MTTVLVHLKTEAGLRTIAAEPSKEEAVGRIGELIRKPAWSTLYGNPSVGDCVILTECGRVGEGVNYEGEVVFALKEIGRDAGIPSAYVWVSAAELLPDDLLELFANVH